MLDLVNAGLNYIFAALPPVSITYRRGTASGVTASASKSHSEYQTADPNSGQWVTVTTTDFLVRIADIGLTPEPFDIIEYGGRRYQVNDPAISEICEGLARVHTRDIGASE